MSLFSDLTIRRTISFAFHFHSIRKQPEIYNIITYPGASILITKIISNFLYWGTWSDVIFTYNQFPKI